MAAARPQPSGSLTHFAAPAWRDRLRDSGLCLVGGDSGQNGETVIEKDSLYSAGVSRFGERGSGFCVQPAKRLSLSINHWLAFSQRERRVDQSKMAERLREVAELPLLLGVVLFGQ